MDNSSSAYYYMMLNKEQQKAYYAMYQGLASLQPAFQVPRLTGRELADIYFMVRMDHPEIFYSCTFQYRYDPTSDLALLSPEYMFQKGKIKEQIQAIEARTAKLVREGQKLPEKERELYIHDLICRTVRYDKLKKPYSHEIIGALGNGVAVCEGMAKAVKLLCDRLGIWCIIALSEANPEKGIKYRHAWNVIRMDGKYYHLDATFDRTLSDCGEVRYDYFNLSDVQIFRDHEPVIWKIPACEDGSRFYYKEKKLSFTKEEEVQKRIAQAAKKGKPFLFQWRGGYLTKEILKGFLQMIDDEAAKREKHAVISLNWPQAVLKVVFEEKLEEMKVVFEEANEGEQEAAE